MAQMSAETELAGGPHKIISISSKRQVTIPQKYYEALRFENEAECILQDEGILIRPVKNRGTDFSEKLLAELIEQGYTGTELLLRFKELSRKGI